MIFFPKAKINLGLRITGKRSDGYHDIETVFYPVGLSDAFEFVIAGKTAREDLFTLSGINTGSDPEDNLIMKTARKLRENYKFPFLKIHLHKAIPVSAGLGGGSSDAACFLKALNRCFNLHIDDHSLKAIALELGSDCPFFLDPVPAYATGRGEKLSPVAPVLKGYYLTLLNPGIGINTREAYQNCHPENPVVSIERLIGGSIMNWNGLIINDFENFACKKFPVIGEIKSELYNSGALFSLMSGSGSSVYGVFTARPSLSARLKEFMIWEGFL